jgi:tryptophan synthase alpha chain
MISGSPANRVTEAFARRRGRGGALLPFVTAGYPTLAATEAALPRMARAGADVIEIGIPFSDPIADGPVIAESMHRALSSGVTPQAVFGAVSRVRAEADAALVAMVSVSIVDRMGRDRFLDECSECGFDGIIVPDLDLDEAEALGERCAARGLAFALLVAPTSPPERAARIASLCRGFVYALARVGLTGQRSALPTELPERVALLRRSTALPIAVGFGISDAAQVRAVLAHADGAIVGSALVQRMGEARDPVSAAENFVRDLAAGAPR